MKKSKCGILCEECYYYRKLCPGCVIESCLVDLCIKGHSFTGITYPKSFCKLREYCPIGGKSKPPPLLLPPLKKKSMLKVNFSTFIPQVDVTDQSSWFWKEEVETSAIFVPLWQLILHKDLLLKALSKSLHDFLEFNGKILLSTVMPDELIDKLKIDDYLKLIEDLKPDATMIPDNYTYTDAPLYQSWSQTIRLVQLANEFLCLDIPLIGLIKGANLRQIYWSLKKEIEMGYVSFVMPSRELFEQGLLNDVLPYVLSMLKKLGKTNNKNFEMLVYGVGRKLKYSRISYSNFSWFLEAKHGLYFRNCKLYDMRDERIRFKECYCDACRGMTPQDLIDLWIKDLESCKRILAIHNLLDWKRNT
ncbi:MAG: hypothetical protein ACP5LN_02665 [Thermoproteota archaeon]